MKTHWEHRIGHVEELNHASNEHPENQNIGDFLSVLECEFGIHHDCPECPTNCITCKLCEKQKQNQCKQKGVVYHIRCNLCDFIYVGEAKGCSGTRINEHASKDNSFVFQHFKSGHPMHLLKWKWKIVCKIKDWYAQCFFKPIYGLREKINL